MRLQVLSDLHNELNRRFGGGVITDIPETDADLVVLAGDIDIGTEGVEWAARQSERLGKAIVYVPGNHEYYHAVFPDVLEDMREAVRDTGVIFLENDTWVYPTGEVRFLGTTLWTDYNASPEVDSGTAMAEAEQTLADYRFIRDAAGNTITGEQLREVFSDSSAWLRRALEQPFDGRTVVVTHMAPSLRSAHPRFGLDSLSAAFIADMEPLMDPQRVALWIHGHTHANSDYQVNGVRVFSNQRGYPAEDVPGGAAFAMDRIIEI